jgi:hypothetical protein
MNGFLPPVIFEIQANAAGAIAQFRRVNTELSIMEAKALKADQHCLFDLRHLVDRRLFVLLFHPMG